MMTKQTEALRIAIEALEMHVPHYIKDRGCEAIQACKEALAQPSVAELNDEYLRDTHVEGLSQPLTRDWKETIDERIAKDDAFKQALEQPAQEPVALLEALSDLEHQQWMKWAQSIMDSEPISDARKQRWATMMVDYKDLPDNIQEYDREWARKVMALYTRPAPAWQGLSDDERFIIVQNADWDNPYDIAELIEQALKEKNT